MFSTRPERYTTNPQKKRPTARNLVKRGKNSGKAPNMETIPMANLRVGLVSAFFGAYKYA
jgi:hypothetical protein